MFNLLIIIFLFCFSCGNSAIPDYINLCHANDVRIAKCIENSIVKLLPKLKTGIRELDVPSIEPLHINTITLKNGVHSNITNLKVFGVSTLRFLDLQADLKQNKFEFKVIIPQLNFFGGYDLDMRILFININGHGPIKGTIRNYYIEGVMNGYLVRKSGKEYLKFKKFLLKVRPGRSQVHLDNLFNGDPVLGQITNSVINSNIDVIMDDITPILEQHLSQLLTDIANKITEKFTYQELFL